MRRVPVVQPVSCGSCGYLEPCGGGHGQLSLGGCFSGCGDACAGSCDWVCPHNDDFVDHVREVGGLEATPERIVPFHSCDLPCYLPMVRHGSSRALPFSGVDVALSIADVTRALRRADRPVTDARGLRSLFGVRADARVLLISVAPDRVLERLWARATPDRIAERLASVGLLGATVPNFSLFSDAPGTHCLWNLRRMAIIAGRFSRAGLEVVPHLNAGQPSHWDYWYSYLREQSGIVFVAKEFQTGLRRRHVGERAVHDLANLQQRLGRELRPVVVGGVGYAALVARHFARPTFVDSQPFMKTISRRCLTKRGWEATPTEGVLDWLLERNVREHAGYVQRQVARGRGGLAA